MCLKDSQFLDSGGSCTSCSGGRRSEQRTFCRFRFLSASFFIVCFALAILSHTPQASCSDSNTLISQSEVKTIEPTNNPTKVFVRRRIFRKLVKDSSNSSNEEPPKTTPQPDQTTTRPRTLYSLVKRLDNTQQQSSSTVTGNMLKNTMSSSQSLASRQKFNFQSLKTRLGLAASGIAESTTTTPSSTTQNASLVMIPLPPSQRKPYTPVIMQVTKSTTSKPDSTVQTFKLNKMFVPIGIYGKVVENSTDQTTEPSAVTTSSTPITSIRHKGTDSGENQKQRKVKGIAESVDITYGRPNLAKVSLTTEKPDIGRISITTEVNELFGGYGDGVFGDENGVRRGDGYGGRRKQQPFTASSGLTLMTPPKLGTPTPGEDSSLTDGIGSYSSYASYSLPQKNKFTPSSIVDSITDSMSRIPSLVPSLFHKGLTSLASMTSSMKENPFVDDNFEMASQHKKQKPLISAPTSYTPKIPASVPGGYINGMGGSGGNGGSNRDQVYAGSELKSGVKSGGSKGSSSVDISEYETLEYFRKRPHLLAQLRKERAESAWRRSQNVRFSKGFKPVNAPEHLAREYYKSTSTTTATTPEEIFTNPAYRSGKKMRGSWLLRNSNEYVANKNDKLIRMWRDMLDSLTADDEEESQPQPTKTRRIDDNIEHLTHEDPSSSSISARRSSPPETPLSAHWSTLKRKYSKDQLNEAKERILTLLDSGYGDEALHEFGDDEDLQHHVDYSHDHDTSSHMPPPPPPRIKTLSLTKGLSGAAAGAFKDLVKFFKLGISVGAGHSREPVNYAEVVDEQEGEEVGGSEWKPVRRPLISFSAGISLKNPGSPLKPEPHHHHSHDHAHHHDIPHSHSLEDYEDDTPLTHYSSSSKPYIPTAYKLNTYVQEVATSSLKPTPYSYAEDDLPPQSLDYAEEEDSQGYGSATSPTYATRPRYEEEPSDYNVYSTLRPGLKSPPTDMQSGSASTWQPVQAGVNPNEYELVPSSVYLNGQNDPRDIAAVVKPAGISDELVRSALPAGLRNLRILDYPNEYRGVSSLNSISQVLGGRVAKPTGETFTSFKHAMKKLRENYVAKESAYLPVEEGYDGGGQGSGGSYVQGVYTTGGSGAGLGGLTGLTGLSGLTQTQLTGLVGSSSGIQATGSLGGLGATYYNPVHHQSSLVGALSGLEGGNVFTTADKINNFGRGSGLNGVYAQQVREQQGQKDPLGFSTNYNLPSNIDPDIAALLKSELDKDDIPEDVRQEFLEAKEQERKEQAQKQQQQQQSYQQQASRRVDNSVDLAQQTLIDSLLNSAAQSQQQEPRQNTQPTAVPLQNYVPQHHHHQPQQHHAHPHPHIHPTNPTPRNYKPISRSFTLHNNPPPPPSPPVLTTRFFAPIPITPTLVSATLKNPRYSSPVPRYVIELARKLQGDKSVQGIVRVSAKRGRGLPPIEYLYPVKG